MALKFSEMTAFRVDLAHNLEAGFDNYLEEIAGGYGAYVAPLLEDGETAPDARLHLELLKRGVVRSRRRLEDFNPGVVEQSHEDDKVRAEIDLRIERVDGKLRLVRHTCRGIYGPKGVRRVGLKEEPPRGAYRLHEHGKTVKASLQNRELGLKPLLQLELGEGADPPQVQLAGQLEPELTELGTLVTERHQENRRAADVRSRRRRLIREFDLEVRAIVRMAQGMFRLAGRDDLAERFRPLLRRVVRRIKKAQAEEAAAEAQAAEAQAAEAGQTESENAETTESSETAKSEKSA